MHLLRRHVIAALLVMLCAIANLAAQERSPALPPPAPVAPELRQSPSGARPGQSDTSAQKPQDEFRPISELPPEERLPAAPMLVAAYIFVVLALFAYVLSLSRRLSAVTQEITRLDALLKRDGRG